MATGSSAVPQISCGIFAQERLFRELVASQLAIHARIHVVAQAGSLADWMRARAAHLPDLLLLIVSRPSGPSLAVARDFMTANLAGRIVAVAGSRHRFRPPHWLARHMVGTVARDASIRTLWGLIDSMVPAPQGNGGDRRLRTRLGGRSLSPREARVFQFMGEGLTSDQIADRLGLSVHTVHTHRKRIAAKLGSEGHGLLRLAVIAAEDRIAPADGGPVGAGLA